MTGSLLIVVWFLEVFTLNTAWDGCGQGQMGGWLYKYGGVHQSDLVAEH